MGKGAIILQGTPQVIGAYLDQTIESHKNKNLIVYSNDDINSENDPVYNTWDKSTGIIVTQYQVRDGITTIPGILAVIGAAEVTLNISSAQTISTSVAIPATLSVTIKKPGLITIATGQTLTINGPFSAGLFQVFNCVGTGSIIFGSGNIKEVYPEWFGAKPDSVTDSTPGIKTAINSACTAGIPIKFSAGTYRVVPATVFTSEAGATTIVANMRSNMHLFSDGGSTIKLADDQSSGPAPVRLSLFGSNEVLANISFRNLIFDMNGDNNHINTPTTPVTTNLYPQASIGFSGTPGGVAAGADNVTIENCSFINNAGVSCIGTAQSNAAGITLRSGWILKNNLFYNNGIDSSDHSSVYGWANDVLADGNRFIQDTIYGVDAGPGGKCAYEVHGSNHRFVNNIVKNYHRGIWVGSNYSSVIADTVISGNTFTVRYAGIDFNRSAAGAYLINNTLIDGNIFRLVESADVSGGVSFAIQVAPNYKTTNVKISNNIAEKTGITNSASFVAIFTGYEAANPQENIIIKGNMVINFTSGVYIKTSNVGGLGEITIINNVFGPLLAANGVAPKGVYTFYNTSATAIDELVIDGNTFFGTGAAGEIGLKLEGIITNRFIGDNTYRLLTTNTEGSATGTIIGRKISGNLNVTGAFITDPAGGRLNIQADIWPSNDDTFYLGKNDDDTPFAWKGVILKDTANGKYYRIGMTNGTVTATDLTD